MPQNKPYFVISGNGRSGSNRLLDILDLSASTACRNEVDEIDGGGFFGIGGKLFQEDIGPATAAALHEAIAAAAWRQSGRDRLSLGSKDYITALGAQFLPLLSKQRVRHVLSSVGLLRSAHEWEIPGVFRAGTAEQKATLVLKLNACPAWSRHLVEVDPDAHIIHNIRNPMEYLSSWYNRFVVKDMGAASFEENFADVPRILSYFDRDDSDRLRNPKEENIIEVEIWRWRYINELIMRKSSLKDKYLLITYREIEQDPASAARKIYSFCGLSFDQNIELQARSMKNVLFHKPHSHTLDAALCRQLLDAVLEDSPLSEILSEAP